MADKLQTFYIYDYREFHQFVTEGNLTKCNMYLREFPEIIDSQNEKGETSLHIAVINGKQNPIIPVLLENKPNVNLRNFWGQTPLHYAAEVKSLETLKRLLQHPGVDANVKDVNGYNALHSYIGTSLEYNHEWIEGFNALIAAHANINSQTNSGKSILHLAAQRSFKCNAQLLSHILRYCHGIKLDLKDFLNQSFLHALMGSNSSENCLEILRLTRKQNPEQFLELFNSHDDLGFSPWMLFIMRNIPFSGELRQSIELGGFIHTVDNFGNTALHNSIGNHQLTEGLLRNGMCINLANVYGLTPAAVVEMSNNETYDIIMKGNVAFDIRDRWGRTPLLCLMRLDLNPNVLFRMLNEYKLDVNCKDRDGTTPLHIAAYNEDELSVRYLLKHGADLDAVDKEGDCPMKTALRHGNFKCYKLLARLMGDVFHKPVPTYKAPPCMSVELLRRNNFDIRLAIPDFPQDMTYFSECLLKRQHITPQEETDEECIITKSVQNLIKSICDDVSNYDPRFKMSVYPTGSSAEGTKVGKPDEFDFALCFESLEEMCDIETSSFQNFDSFACLKFRPDPIPEEYVGFSDEDHFFISGQFLTLLFWYLKKALYQSERWKNGNIGFSGELVFLKEKPVINFGLFWIGSKYKYLTISIDLVPAVYKKRWWPTEDSLENKQLVSENVKNEGCFILLQTKLRNFRINRLCLTDAITESQIRTEYTKNERRSYRVSCAPAEITLMRSLPEVFREAYVLAKAVKSTDVTPKVVIDQLPKSCKREGEAPEVVSPADEIKSYWLKNCIFYVAESMQHEVINASRLEITRLIYKKLLNFSTECKIKPYLLTDADVYQFEKDKKISTDDLRMLLLKRKLCIDMVFSVLELPVADDITEWLATCEQNYWQQYPAEQEPKPPLLTPL